MQSFNSLRTGTYLQTISISVSGSAVKVSIPYERERIFRPLCTEVEARLVRFQFPTNGNVSSDPDESPKSGDVRCFNSLRTGTYLQTYTVR